MIVNSVLLVVVVSGLAVVLLFAFLSATSRRPNNLGLAGGRLRPCPSSPNCVCSQDEDAGHRIEPIRYAGEDPIGRLAAVVAAMPRAKVVTTSDNYLHAEFTSLIFRFVDDVEFLVAPDSGTIHCRSASRAGHSDLGVNRRRVEAIRQAFSEQGAGKPAH